MIKNRMNKKTLKYLVESLIMLFIVLAIAYGCCLKTKAMIVLSIYSLVIIPFIIKAWIKQTRSINRFNCINNYLTNIIPIFMQRTKIRYTLGELYEICDGEMKDAIYSAIDYIDNTKDDPNLMANGLKKIEEKFPNSRIISVHKFLLSVENTDSRTYKDIAENLYKDIEKWINRTIAFEKDIKDRRNKILALCFITLVMNVMFVYIYVSNEYFKGFVNIENYQISTTIFIAVVIFVIGVIIVKLNGEWLVDDLKKDDEEYLKDKYRKYKQGIEKIKVIDVIIALVFLGFGVFSYIKEINYVAVFCLAFSIIVITNKRNRYFKNKNYLAKKLTIEFPMWLREISLSLGNYTVLNAIENSLSSASYPMRREIRKLLHDCEDNPSSIAPYNDFLSEYNIDEVKSSMRVLYAINNVAKEDMKDRTSKLIERNQDLLAKSELLRGNDSIGGIEMIGYLPTLIFSVQMIISMLIMFEYMMQMLGGQVNL